MANGAMDFLVGYLSFVVLHAVEVWSCEIGEIEPFLAEMVNG